MGHGEAYCTTVISLQEFAMSGVEDWMTVSTYSPGMPAASAPPDPVWKLEWAAEQIRARAHSPDHGGSGVKFTEWAEFSSTMSQEMRDVILATSSADVTSVDFYDESSVGK